MLAHQQTEFVFGGSFDPVHLGHINLITYLKQFSKDSQIRILPCATPPLKERTIAPFEQRVRMLKAALGKDKNVIIDQRENIRSGKSFTFDSLQQLRYENPDTRLLLVLGTDAINSINQWYFCEKLSHLCHLVIANRPRNTLNKIETTLCSLGYKSAKSKQELEFYAAGRYHCLSIKELDISSTQIRERLAKNLSVKDLLCSKVIDYINRHQPY